MATPLPLLNVATHRLVWTQSPRKDDVVVAPANVIQQEALVMRPDGHSNTQKLVRVPFAQARTSRVSTSSRLVAGFLVLRDGAHACDMLPSMPVHVASRGTVRPADVPQLALACWNDLGLDCYSVSDEKTMLYDGTPVPWDDWLLHALQFCDVDVMEHLEDAATTEEMKSLSALPDSLFN